MTERKIMYLHHCHSLIHLDHDTAHFLHVSKNESACAQHKVRQLIRLSKDSRTLDRAKKTVITEFYVHFRDIDIIQIFTIVMATKSYM